MHWPKSLLAQIVVFAVALAVLLPLALPCAGRHMVAYVALAMIWWGALPITLAHWVAADLRSQGRTPPYELPFLLLLVWPLSLFWYCIWTRGPQGLLMATGLVLLSYLPFVTMSFYWLLWVIVTQ